jgi:UDPglucose 6-dehydrogenase
MTKSGSKNTAGYRLSVVGLGKLGAPMAAVFAAKGFEVTGVGFYFEAGWAVNAGGGPGCKS